jgi:peptidoglycan/LPS O-acetylase OafA/YrhL
VAVSHYLSLQVSLASRCHLVDFPCRVFAFRPYLGPASRNFLLYVPCFLPGVIAYQLQRTTRPQFPAVLWLGVVIATLLLFLYKQFLVSNYWLKSWLACLAFGLAVVFFGQISSRCLTVPSRLIAQYSYGIYLTHFFCIWLAFNRLRDVLPRSGQLRAICSRKARYVQALKTVSGR